ncbi:MAG: pseudouridine synthase [Eubacteriales bacterium]
MRSFTINQNDGGQRLDKFVTKTVRGLPASLMYKYIRTKRIKVNGKRTEPRQMLAAGDLVEMYIPDEFFTEQTAEAEFTRAHAAPQILYEDDNILLCDKRPGLLTHPGDRDEAGSDEASERETLIFQIQAYLYRKGEYDPQKENSFSPALCNRIDRNTGGIVIAAKNADALRAMNAQLRLGNVHKTYLCAVHGKMPQKEELLHGYLTKNTKTKTVTVQKSPARGAKEIATGYRVLAYASEHDLSLLEVRLLTGRTHQIRAHLASVGHPLLGEGKYGVNRSDRALGFRFQALYSYRVAFTIPEGTLSYLDGRTFAARRENVRFLSLFPSYTLGAPEQGRS